MLALFGSVAVATMFVSYWLERRSKWMVLVFALGCAMTAAWRVDFSIPCHGHRRVMGVSRVTTVCATSQE